MLRELCDSKGVNIVEAECIMLVEIPLHLSISSFIGHLKSKSSFMIFDKYANLKYKYGNAHFGIEDILWIQLGRYELVMKDYIKNRLEDDIMNAQISLKEFADPFTDKPVK